MQNLQYQNFSFCEAVLDVYCLNATVCITQEEKKIVGQIIKP